MTPGGVHSPVRAFRAVGGAPVFMASAQGSRIRDVDGNDYVDYVGSWGPAILGHAHSEVVEAVRAAAGQGLSFGTPHAREGELAEMIRQMVPSVEKVRFCNSGTEATMSCVRLARGFTDRSKIVKFTGCYHGHSDALLVAAGSGALTLGRPDSAGVTEGATRDTVVLPFHDSTELKRAFASFGNEIAAILVEPVPANAGLLIPDPQYLQLLREIATQHQSLLIFDEVMTGFRLGSAGAQGLYGIRPDLSTFGKVIGGGMPVGAFGGRAEVMDFLAPEGPVYQAGTLSGNPMAMAAGIAQLRVLARGGVYEKLEVKAKVLEKIFQEEISSAGVEVTWTRMGSMFCLFFQKPGSRIQSLAEAQRSDPKAYANFFHGLLRGGVYFPPSQYETCFLSVAHDDLDFEITRQALRTGFRHKA